MCVWGGENSSCGAAELSPEGAGSTPPWPQARTWGKPSTAAAALPASTHMPALHRLWARCSWYSGTCGQRWASASYLQGDGGGSISWFVVVVGIGDVEGCQLHHAPAPLRARRGLVFFLLVVAVCQQGQSGTAAGRQLQSGGDGGGGEAAGSAMVAGGSGTAGPCCSPSARPVGWRLPPPACHLE